MSQCTLIKGNPIPKPSAIGCILLSKNGNLQMCVLTPKKAKLSKKATMGSKIWTTNG